ncbi:hypothetical protein BSKO_13395 [Bryopsis sp. KO-2023]|nr:hypothetical protein BSKO_13395 [Bryopsis sp. KO-2023]
MHRILTPSRLITGACSGRLGALSGGAADPGIFRLCFVDAASLLSTRQFCQSIDQSEGQISSPSEFFAPKVAPGENLEANLKILERWGMPRDAQHRVKGQSTSLGTASGEILEAKLELLEKEVGIEKRQVAKVVEQFYSYLDRPSTRTVEPFLGLFRSGGIPEAEIKYLILKRPPILGFHAKLHEMSIFFQKELNIELKEFLQLVIKFPQLAGYHIDQNIRKKLDYFLEVGISREQFSQMVRKFPQIIGLSLQSNIKFKIDALAEEGVPKEKFTQTLVRAPQLLGRKFPTILDKLKGLQRDMDVSAEGAFTLLNRNMNAFQTSAPRWAEMQEALVSSGFSSGRAAKLLIRNSKLLKVSRTDLIEKIKFAKYFLGKNNTDLWRNTRYLTASYQDKIFFRAVFLASRGEDLTKVKLPALVKSEASFFGPFDKTLVKNFRIKWGEMSQAERLTAIIEKSVQAQENSEEKSEEKSDTQESSGEKSGTQGKTGEMSGAQGKSEEKSDTQESNDEMREPQESSEGMSETQESNQEEREPQGKE